MRMRAPFRYARLGYVVLEVTDVARSTTFYRDLVGLDLDRQDSGDAYLRCCESRQNIVLTQGPTPGLRRIAFELESKADLEKAHQYLEEQGFSPRPVAAEEAQRLKFDAGLRFREPGTSLEFEFFVDPEKAAEPFSASKAEIARLGHIVLNVADFDTVYDSLVGKLNFLVSDEVAGKIAFLRCFPNPFHHSLALISAPANGYNHVNFMVSDIDDIGRGINRMKKANVPIVFGPGRHLPSGSIFLYFLDPDGMTTEYSFGMEEFEEEHAREPRELEPTPETLDTWGSTPDPRFGKTGALLPAHV
jgi:2,3-dihydroxy-p-cumate/2,3-dihydroxybenzoate 3,4-dioxygenase